MNRTETPTNGQRRLIARVLVGLACTAAVLAAWWSVTQFHMRRRDAAARVAVNFPPPEAFPLLVLTEDHGYLTPHIVYFARFENFKREHPEYSLYVPPNAVGRLNGELDRRSRYHGGGSSEDPWFARFTVRQLSSDHELIQVEATWDDDRKNVGWYEVESKAFRPRFHKFYFGPGVALVSCSEATLQVLVPSIFVAAVAFITAQRRKGRRAPAA